MPDRPERDRVLAARPRAMPRRASDVADVAASWMRSDEAKELRRFGQVKTGLIAALPPELLQRVQIGSVRRGVLTLQTADGVALAELKQHYDQPLRRALVEAGAGIARIVYRLQRTGRAAKGG